MKRFMRTVFMVLMAGLLAGCFQTDLVIKVNHNGSGTLEQTVRVRKDVMDQMRAMAQSFAQEGQPQEDLNLLDEEELKETAKKLGKGVKYVKAEEINNENFEGYKAIFSFKDINDLNIDQNPSGSLPSDDSEEKTPPEFITFKFKKGKTSKLTITMPKNNTVEQASANDRNGEAMAEDGQDQLSDEASEGPSDEQQEQMMMAMMQEMMNGMKVRIAVEINGKIKKTNATFRKDNLITLMDIDFNKLLASEKEFKEFVKVNPGTMSAAKEIMQKIPGMQMEMEQAVKVEFN